MEERIRDRPKCQTSTLRWRSGPLFLLLVAIFSLLSLNRERLFLALCDKNDKTTDSMHRCSSIFSVLNSEHGATLNNNTEINRVVTFLHPSNFGSYGEYYSGMWWQRRDHFMKTNYDEIELLEEASFQSFFYHENRDIRLTKDWMDFAVEHLSQYVKLLMSDPVEDAVADQIARILTEYIQRTIPYNVSHDPDLAVHSTIAVLPLRVTSNDQRKNELLALELAATLVSLWRVGIPRAIVVGVSENEEAIANQSFSLLHEKMLSFLREPMEVQSIEYVSASGQSKRLVPKLALRALQSAFQQSEEETESEHVHSWLGSNPQRWKYVYFSEPDLVLQMRYSAMSAISRTLEHGRLMAAHRLEPIPHARDFPLINTATLMDRVVPNSKAFAIVDEIDPLQGDVCCDQGRYYPANRASSQTQEEVRHSGGCVSTWVHCGFQSLEIDYHDESAVLEIHHRLVRYPFFTIQGGTGLPLVGANQRMCQPKKHDVCDSV